MLKRTALTFILLANIILLAHAVLPHHHHKEQVCTKCKYYVDDDILCATETSSEHHQHNSKTTSECILKQAIIIPSTQDKLFRNYDHFSLHHHLDFYIHSGFGHVDVKPVSISITSLPGFSTFLSSLECTTIGLRAPPIV